MKSIDNYSSAGEIDYFYVIIYSRRSDIAKFTSVLILFMYLFKQRNLIILKNERKRESLFDRKSFLNFLFITEYIKHGIRNYRNTC